jgi:thiol:disulfide interchange protein DsbD
MALVGMSFVVIALRETGTHLGWGMHFQYPPFVAMLTALVFVFALNAFDFFAWGLVLQGRPLRDSLWSSLGAGIFAALMSTPCTAPFLGTAAGFALYSATPPWLLVSIFASIGLGLASPFLGVAFVPAIAHCIPKPGPWMQRVKQFMGFLLLATAVWLYGILQKQITPDAAIAFLGMLLLGTMVLWGIEALAKKGVAPWIRRLSMMAGVCVLAAAGLRLDLRPADVMTPKTSISDGIPWVPFSDEALQNALGAGHAVFVDFTADWCVSCKANEALVLETDRVRDTLKKYEIVPMKADLTQSSPVLEARLASLGRSGIPTYVIYFPNGKYDLWPVVITVGMAVERLESVK